MVNILTGGTATKTAAGDYPVTADFVPTDSANYNTLAGLTAGDFVISKATPTATLAVNNTPVTYDATPKAATVAISASSVPGAVANILTGGTATKTAAGTYAVTADFVPIDSANYNTLAALAAGDFVISKATLTVAADNKTKTLGAIDPAFTASYAGFANSETPAVLNGTLTFSRAPGETVGSYLITPGGLTSPNYTITFNTGTLTITPATAAPVMFPLTGAGTPNVVITWSAISNVTYRLQYTPDLRVNNWSDLVGDVTATGTTASKTDIRTTTNRFYRVQALP